MSLRGEHLWQIGDLLGCLDHEQDFSRLNFCLLLLATNRECISHVVKLRSGTALKTDVERSKLTEGLLQFQHGAIKSSVANITSIDQDLLTASANKNGDNWSDFFQALYVDMIQIFSETPRDWVEGSKLNDAGKLHPIAVVGDSHVLAAGWGYGENWFSRPYYVPGLQLSSLASNFDNRAKSGFVATIQSLQWANHIILSLGEIDYRLTHVRRLMSKKRFDLKEITDEAEIEAIMIVEKKRCYRAVKFLSKCFVPGQNVSILSIQRPQRQRLQQWGLSDDIIGLEEEFIDRLNRSLQEVCAIFKISFISTDVDVTDLDWFNDGVHKKNSFHKRWLEKYASERF